MHRRSLFTGVSIALATLIGGGLFIGHSAPSHAQSSTAPIAEIALSKNLTGPVSIHGAQSYKCQVLGKTVQMATLPLSLYFTTTPNTHCDELYHDFNGAMACSWTLTLRTDEGGFGIHTGTFHWQDTLGNVVEGTMQGTVGCGTHRLPGVHEAGSATEDCEECRAALHVEGTLTGHVVSGPLKTQYGSVALNASYAGSFDGGSLTAIKSATLSLDGVTIVPVVTTK